MRTMAFGASFIAAAALLTIPAHAGPAIPSAFGTATLDGIMSPGEWSAATPISVFDNLVGSKLYVMDDNVNLYLGLFVPDGTLTPDDAFAVRIDSQNDDVTGNGDDEILVSGTGHLYDNYCYEGYWGFMDLQQNGSGGAGLVAGGNFLEMSHPLNGGDPQDLFVMPGGTIGLCARYSNDGSALGADTYPLYCLYAGASQAEYADYVISPGRVGVGTGVLSGGARIALRPNPVRRGGVLELRFAMPAGATAMRAGVYAVSGKEMARLADGSYPAGEQSVRWTVPIEGSDALNPGVYFVRAWIGDETARATLIIAP
jgi:hypothetical protein